MIVHLVIVEPASRRGRHKVRLPLLVGRSPEAKFRIQQDRVSRRHCELSAVDGVVYLRDLGSRNGTLLEGSRVPTDDALPVPPGAVVQVGNLSFVVEYDRLAETPTVASGSGPSASSLTLGPAASAPFDVEIRFESDGGSAPSAAGSHPRMDPTSAPPPAAADDGGDELQRFLEGLS